MVMSLWAHLISHGIERAERFCLEIVVGIPSMGSVVLHSFSPSICHAEHAACVSASFDIALLSVQFDISMSP